MVSRTNKFRVRSSYHGRGKQAGAGEVFVVQFHPAPLKKTGPL